MIADRYGTGLSARKLERDEDGCAVLSSRRVSCVDLGYLLIQVAADVVKHVEFVFQILDLLRVARCKRRIGSRHDIGRRQRVRDLHVCGVEQRRNRVPHECEHTATLKGERLG